MSLVAVFVAIGLVLAIAAVLVVREAGRIGRRPPAALFYVDDALDWVVEHLDDLVAATLTVQDVARILDLEAEYLETLAAGSGAGPATEPGGNGHGNGSRPPARDAIVGGDEQVRAIVDAAARDGLALLPEQVHAVLETQLAYLRFIGAVGDAAGPADPDDRDLPPA